MAGHRLDLNFGKCLHCSVLLFFHCLSQNLCRRVRAVHQVVCPGPLEHLASPWIQPACLGPVSVPPSFLDISFLSLSRGTLNKSSLGEGRFYFSLRDETANRDPKADSLAGPHSIISCQVSHFMKKYTRDHKRGCLLTFTGSCLANSLIVAQSHLARA